MRALAIFSFLALSTLTNLAHAVNPEPYTSRPRIEDITAKDHHISNEDWQNCKVGFLRYLATLYFYPENYHFYFLARDFEVAYDMIRILLKGDKFLDRIHLISASRPSIKDANLWKYLESEGINNSDPNRVHMLADTGMLGTIPDFINKTAPKELKGKIKASHLLSANRAYTTSRAFLTALDPKAIRGSAKEWEYLILIFENFPHHTWRSTRYENLNGKWTPMGEPTYKPPGMSMGGMDFGFGGGALEEIEPRESKEALKFMADTKAFAEKDSNLNEFRIIASVLRKLGIAYRNAVLKQDRSLFDNALNDLDKNKKLPSILIDAIKVDVQEIITRHAPYGKLPTTMALKKKAPKKAGCKNHLGNK